MDSNNHSRKLSKSHITEKRFIPYGKASDYVKHLVNFYDLQKHQTVYDESSILQKIFREQTPINSIHKLSKMPKSNLTIELSEKIRLLNAFHNLSERKVKKIQIKEKSLSPPIRKSRNHYFARRNYNTFIKKLSNDLNLNESNHASTFLTDSKNNKFYEAENKNRVHSQNRVLMLPKESNPGSPFSSRYYNKGNTFYDKAELESNPAKSSRMPKLSQLKSNGKKAIDKDLVMLLNRRSLISPKKQFLFNPSPKYLDSSKDDEENKKVDISD